MICSKTKSDSELYKITRLLLENGYPADVLLSYINQKLANFAVEKVWSREVPGVPKIALDWYCFIKVRNSNQ